MGLDAFAVNSAPVKIRNHIITASNDPLVPVGFDCSKIEELGIHKQENFRAGAIMLACAADGTPGSSSVGAFFQRVTQGVKKLLVPLYGAGDVNLINHPETSPNITQSETFTTVNPDNPQQIVVAYNDSRGRNVNPNNISGASVSTDGGATFDRLTKANGQSPFDNTAGDPVVLYNSHTATWFTVWLDAGCGGQGLGGYKSTTPSDPNSWTHYCIHSGTCDDRESGWADNNSSSPFFGRMYVSWNDFVAARASSSRSPPTTVLPGPALDRSPLALLHPQRPDHWRQDHGRRVHRRHGRKCGQGCIQSAPNKIFRSTDGGNTWTNTYTGPSLLGPMPQRIGLLLHMYLSPAYWRHMGWGEPAAFNHVVSSSISAKRVTTPATSFIFALPTAA